MRSRTTRITRLLAVPALAAVLTLGVTQPADATPAPADRGHADELISLVDKDRTTFGGISFDESTGTATIRYDDAAGERTARTRLGSLTDQRANGWRVDLRQVRHSLAELDTVRRKVATDPVWRAVAGKALAKWYIDVRTNRVAVGVTALTPEIRSAAAALFGDAVSLHVAARPDRATRLDDVEPWSAGIRLNLSPGGGCTGGFVIRSVSTPDLRRLVGAGHCGSLGATVRNNGDLVGTVVERQLAQNGLDYAHIGGRAYQALMYTGGATGNLRTPVSGTTLSAVGLSVCTNGSTSGENCAGVVNAIDLCVTFSDGITTCFLDEARSTNGSTLSRPGDSGGPVVAFDSEGLKVVGTIIGGAATTYFHAYHYLVPAGWAVDTR